MTSNCTHVSNQMKNTYPFAAAGKMLTVPVFRIKVNDILTNNHWQNNPTLVSLTLHYISSKISLFKTLYSCTLNDIWSKWKDKHLRSFEVELISPLTASWASKDWREMVTSVIGRPCSVCISILFLAGLPERFSVEAWASFSSWRICSLILSCSSYKLSISDSRNYE